MGTIGPQKPLGLLRRCHATLRSQCLTRSSGDDTDAYTRSATANTAHYNSATTASRLAVRYVRVRAGTASQ